jgi:hypothetical protein
LAYQAKRIRQFSDHSEKWGLQHFLTFFVKFSEQRNFVGRIEPSCWYNILLYRDFPCLSYNLFFSAKANRQKSQENSPDSRQSYIDGAEEPEHEQVEAELPPYLPSVYGCRNMEEFEVNFRLFFS